ncbi:MAG: PEP-CTERM sorting domain-containing protein, partial [Cyanobacteria bacterium P01_G01_bin.49]
EDTGLGQISFTSMNGGFVSSSLADLYSGISGIIDNSLGIVGTVISTSGLDYDENVDPEQLQEQTAYTQDSNSGNLEIVVNRVNRDTGSRRQESSILNNNIQSNLNSFSNSTEDRELAIAFSTEEIGFGSEGVSYGSNSTASQDIPEPFTILGTGIAFGFGGLFKRKYDKTKNKEKITA